MRRGCFKAASNATSDPGAPEEGIVERLEVVGSVSCRKCREMMCSRGGKEKVVDVCQEGASMLVIVIANTFFSPNPNESLSHHGRIAFDA